MSRRRTATEILTVTHRANDCGWLRLTATRGDSLQLDPPENTPAG